MLKSNIYLGFSIDYLYLDHGKNRLSELFLFYLHLMILFTRLMFQNRRLKNRNIHASSMKGDSFASKLPSVHNMTFCASTRLRLHFHNFRNENFKKECFMQFSFGKHENVNDIRYLLSSLNLENILLYVIYRRYFFDRFSFQHPWFSRFSCTIYTDFQIKLGG